MTYFSWDSLVGNLYVCSACILLLWFVIFLNRKHLLGYGGKSGTGYLVLWIVFTLYSVFYCPPIGDNYSALETYNSYYGGIKWEYLHYEEIHFKIMDLAPWGYFTWRFLLWGIMGATAYVFLCKKLNLNKHLATIACCTFALPVLFYYQRGVVGYILIYLSLTYCIQWIQTKKIRYVLVAYICVLAAIPFHNAMIFYVIVAYLSLVMPLNKKTLIFLLLGAVVVHFTLLDTIIFFLEKTSEDTAETAMRYVEANVVAGKSNFAGILSWLITKGPIYMMLFFCVKKYLKEPSNFNLFEKTFLLNVIFLFGFSILLSSTSTAISVKFMKAGYLPLTLFLSLYFDKYRWSKECRYFVYSLLFGIVVTGSYAILKGTFWGI